MNYSPSSRDAIDEHCREVIRSCLNIVEQHGDTYVAIHKDDDIECIVLVSMIRSYPILSIIVADKLLLADINEEQMHSIANELNLVSVTGWHSVFLADDIFAMSSIRPSMSNVVNAHRSSGRIVL